MTLLPERVRRPADPGERAVRARPVGSRVRAYVALTKPRIIELLLVTTVPAMLLAARGVPPLGLVALTLLGGTLTAGSANALNCFFDRDIDAVMPRTRRRPLPAAAVSPGEALAVGCVTGVAGAAVLARVGALAAALAVSAIGFYVLGYTLGLKRRTSANIVWGGAAGCAPVLVGWAAVTGRVDWPAVVLFLVVFLWTPPHFWALAVRFRGDYSAAGVPMLPSVAPPEVVGRRIVAYTWLTVAASLVLVPVAPTGVGYAASAVLLGAWFLVEAHRLGAGLRGEGRPRPMRLFRASITYLTLLSVALSLDAVVDPPLWHASAPVTARTAATSAPPAYDAEPCPAPGTPGVDGRNQVLAGLDLGCLGAGAAVSLGRLGGSRPVLVNLWASWCRPCLRETPRLQRAHAAAGSRVLFLGVDSLDTATNGRSFVAGAGARYPQLTDPDGTVRARLAAAGLPLTVVLDPAGRVVFRKSGELSAADLARALAAARNPS